MEITWADGVQPSGKRKAMVKEPTEDITIPAYSFGTESTEGSSTAIIGRKNNNSSTGVPDPEAARDDNPQDIVSGISFGSGNVEEGNTKIAVDPESIENPATGNGGNGNVNGNNGSNSGGNGNNGANGNGAGTNAGNNGRDRGNDNNGSDGKNAGNGIRNDRDKDKAKDKNNGQRPDDQQSSNGRRSDKMPDTDPGTNQDKRRALYVMDELVERGWSEVAAAGAVGNLLVEAPTLSPDTSQGQGDNGQGIAQWSLNGRWRVLQNFAGNRGLSPHSLDAQIQFIDNEAKNVAPWKQTFPSIQKADTPEEAAFIFERKYEKPGIPHRDRRKENAKKILELYQQLAG